MRWAIHKWIKYLLCIARFETLKFFWYFWNQKYIIIMKKHIFYITLLAWLTIDLLSKYVAFTYLDRVITIIWDFLSLELLMNPGIAFGLTLDHAFLKVLTISLILWIFYYYFTEEKKKKSVLIDTAFWLILAGAIWNWLERVFRGEVVDFISVRYFSVFNLADSFITIGAILYIYVLYKETKK